MKISDWDNFTQEQKLIYRAMQDYVLALCGVKPRER